MEIKGNDSTRNRPEGRRTLDAPFVSIDINFYMREVKNEEAWQKNDRNAITVFKSDEITMVLSALHKNAVITDNSTAGILIVEVLEGQIKVTVEGEEAVAGEREVVTLHRNTDHTIEAQEESVLLLTVTGEK